MTKLPLTDTAVSVLRETVFSVNIMFCNNYIPKGKYFPLNENLLHASHVTNAQSWYDVFLHIDSSLHSAVLLEISQTLAATSEYSLASNLTLSTRPTRTATEPLKRNRCSSHSTLPPLVATLLFRASNL